MTVEPTSRRLERDWTRVGVYGMGASGVAAARLLRRRGIDVVAFDGRREEELDLDRRWCDGIGDRGVDWRLGREPGALPDGLDALVVSPGVPLSRPLVEAARARRIEVLAEVELAFGWLKGDVVAITGSNGKSTTTALAGALLRAAGHRVEVCGNIGRPLSDCVDGPAERLFVLELSSFQLEGTLELRPRAAAVLNLSQDHLDRYENFDAYVAAKLRIFARQTRDDIAIVNADDPVLAACELPPPPRRRSFSSSREVRDGCYLSGDDVVEISPGAEPRKLFQRQNVPLPGPHNLENAMAASLLALAVGARVDALGRGFAAFVGLPHRLEKVGEWRGVAYYDDSKGTNPAATERSLAAFPDRSVHLILGGRNKGSDLTQLRPAVSRKARGVYLIGEAASELEAALKGAVPIHLAGTLQEAVAMAAKGAAAGDVVLLSPACASFDQFTSFEDRGRSFQAFARSLGGSNG